MTYKSYCYIHQSSTQRIYTRDTSQSYVTTTTPQILRPHTTHSSLHMSDHCDLFTSKAHIFRSRDCMTNIQTGPSIIRTMHNCHKVDKILMLHLKDFLIIGILEYRQATKFSNISSEILLSPTAFPPTHSLSFHYKLHLDTSPRATKELSLFEAQYQRTVQDKVYRINGCNSKSQQFQVYLFHNHL